MWEEMKAAGVEGNTYVYVALINACERSSDWQRALQVFYAMRVRPPCLCGPCLHVSVCVRKDLVCVGGGTVVRESPVVEIDSARDANHVKWVHV